jgi:hypothetical protein
MQPHPVIDEFFLRLGQHGKLPARGINQIGWGMHGLKKYGDFNPFIVP